jgi:adenosine deaminase
MKHYLKAEVPICLSTDDAGILRTSLKDQYALAVEYIPEMDYFDLKEMAENSIKYSFLSEQEKSEQLKELEQRFLEFEEEIAD